MAPEVERETAQVLEFQDAWHRLNAVLEDEICGLYYQEHLDAVALGRLLKILHPPLPED